MSGFSKPSLEVTDVSTLPLDVMNVEITLAVKDKHRHMDTVNFAKNVSYKGYNYRTGMVVAHGSLAGLLAGVL